MKASFSLKFKKFDIFIISFVLVAIVSSIIMTNVLFSRIDNDNKIVEIYYQGKLLEDKTVKMKEVENEIEVVLLKSEYKDLLGDITIIINKNKGVCISEVSCPNLLCKKTGWVNSIAYPLSCLPNGVVVMITSPDPDQDIILG